MAKQPYLLQLEERAGDNTFITRHLIEAESLSDVKYRYHKRQKESGYTDTQYGKHTLECWDIGLMSDIHSIRKLEQEEYDTLSKFLPNWDGL